MRFLVKFFFSFVFRKISFSFCKYGGRNFLGRICVYHKGGASKVKGLLIDRFRRLKQSGFIIKILKISGITAFIGLILYNNGLSSFIILSENTFLGSYIYFGALLPLNKTLNFSSALLLKKKILVY